MTGAFGNSYSYDAVGNQTSRTVGGVSYTQSFDYDNRLVGVAGGQRRCQLPVRRRWQPRQGHGGRRDDRLPRRAVRVAERRGDAIL